MRLALIQTLLAVAVIATLTPGFASAQELTGGTYGTNNDAWDGLSDFVRLAENEGVPFEITDTVDLNTLRPTDRLVFVYPQNELPAGELGTFVVDGGKVLLADDFGRSTAFLDRLGIRRADPGSVPHRENYLNRPALPLFRRQGKHPLLEGVEEVVANHPAILTTDGGAILAHDDPSFGLVYDMRLAEGKVVVVGDASLLINHMLRVKDNKRFARNTIGYLCKEVPECRPKLVVGPARFVGSYSPVNTDSEKLGSMVDRAIDTLNGALDAARNFSPPKQVLYFASLILMLGVVLFVLAILRLRVGPRVAPRTRPPADIHPLSEFEWNLQRFEQDGFRVNYALPAALLRDSVERRFFRLTLPGKSVPAASERFRANFIREACKAYVEKTLPKGSAEEKVEHYKLAFALLKALSKVPERHRLFLDNDVNLSEKELMRLYADAQRVMSHFDTKDPR